MSLTTKLLCNTKLNVITLVRHRLQVNYSFYSANKFRTKALHDCKYNSAINSNVGAAQLSQYVGRHCLRGWPEMQLRRQQQAMLECRRFYVHYDKNKPKMKVPQGVFAGLLDHFRGVTIDSNEAYREEDDFSKKLEKSLKFWIENKNRAIWFRVHTEHADWLPILVKAGFQFHHAVLGVVTVYRWLPNDEPVNLPTFAHTLLGVGGLVINDKEEILVVSDRFGRIPGSWKLPGGYVEPRENLIDAVIREVREETSIDTEFRSVISFRHSHGGNFGCSDIYIVMQLYPRQLKFKADPIEIRKVQWMPIKDFLSDPNVHETNRHFVEAYQNYKKRHIKMTCKHTIHSILKRAYSLYYVACDSSDSENCSTRGKANYARKKSNT